ncbi:protocatechuate 3,4-dioxygenase beta subunit [Bradyrhizobium sp. USDA 4449]
MNANEPHPKNAVDVSAEVKISEDCVGCPGRTDGTCLLTPQATEGPYYLDNAPERQNITDGRRGLPLDLHLRIIDAERRPASRARIDIWQADAQGIYSGFALQGDDANIDTTSETFLRGFQHTDDAGIVKFHTIYPGWYRGRTPHIHAKVSIETVSVLNAQIYFPDALNEFIFGFNPRYVRPISRDTLNATDQFLKPTGHSTFSNLREEADSYVASLVLVVDRSARSPKFVPMVPRAAGEPPRRLPAGPDLSPDERVGYLMPK